MATVFESVELRAPASLLARLDAKIANLQTRTPSNCDINRGVVLGAAIIGFNEMALCHQQRHIDAYQNMMRSSGETAPAAPARQREEPGMDRRFETIVFVSDDVWVRFMDKVRASGRSCSIDDAVELALLDFARLDHDEVFRRLRRFEPPTADTEPTEAAAAPA